MGVYTWMPQGDYVRGTVKRIDRKHGEIDVSIKKPKTNTSSYSKHKIENKMAQHLDSRCVLLSDPTPLVLGVPTKTRLESSIRS